MSNDQSSVVTLKVRVSPEFREKIIDTAKANSRSMNAEIVHRLEESFETQLQDFDINSPLFYAAYLSIEISKLRAKVDALKFAIETSKSKISKSKLTILSDYTGFEVINCHAELIKTLQDNDLNATNFSNSRIARSIAHEISLYYESDRNLSDDEMRIKYPNWGDFS